MIELPRSGHHRDGFCMLRKLRLLERTHEYLFLMPSNTGVAKRNRANALTQPSESRHLSHVHTRGNAQRIQHISTQFRLRGRACQLSNTFSNNTFCYRGARILSPTDSLRFEAMLKKKTLTDLMSQDPLIARFQRSILHRVACASLRIRL